MKIVGRLTTLAVVAALAWQHQGLLASRARLLLNAVPITRTYVEMESYRGGLGEHIRVNGAPPADVPRWLDANFDGRGKVTLGNDEFGSPYAVRHDDADKNWMLVSCGPDRTCGNDDDMSVPLVAINATKRGRPW